MTEMDVETSVHYVHLTRLVAREDYIKCAIVIFIMVLEFFSLSVYGW